MDARHIPSLIRQSFIEESLAIWPANCSSQLIKLRLIILRCSTSCFYFQALSFSRRGLLRMIELLEQASRYSM